MPSFFMYHMDWQSCAFFKVLVSLLCPTLCDAMDCKPTRFLCPWDSPGKNTEMGSHSLLQGISQPGVEPGSSILQADALPYEPPEIQLYHYAFYVQSKFSMALSHLDPHIITNNHANASHWRQLSEIRSKGNRKK